MTSGGEPRVPVHVWGPQARHARWDGATPFDTLTAALAAAGDGPVVVVDGAAIVPRDLAGDVRRAITDRRLDGIPWHLLAAGGTTFAGAHRSNVTFPQGPAAAADYHPRPLLAADPDLVVVRRGDGTPPASLADLVAAGWDRGRAAYLSPYLRCSRDVEPLAPDPHPPLDPATAGRRLDGVRAPPTVAAVVRTTLGRPHLLRRCLASLAALDPAADAVLLVGEAPAAGLAAAAAELGGGLAVEAIQVSGSGAPGRTAALTAGIARSTTDYVWFVDDDDAAVPGAVAAIRAAVATRARPLVVGESVAYAERWDGERLANAYELRRWDPADWPRAFTGWNFLPVCSLAYPREATAQRLAAAPLRHDLGEDYALALLVLATPGLDVVEATGTLARVSIRDDGTNAVTDTDRTAWLQDGAAFMSDLSADAHAASPVLWSLGEALRDSVPPARHAELVDAAAQAVGWRTLARRAVPPRLRPALRRLLGRGRKGYRP